MDSSLLSFLSQKTYVTSVTDSTFSSCAIDRPSGGSATGRMYLVNHYLVSFTHPLHTTPHRCSH